MIILCPPVEVLLDMNAAEGELGWLTSPYEDGVSIYTSADISPHFKRQRVWSSEDVFHFLAVTRH